MECPEKEKKAREEDNKEKKTSENEEDKVSMRQTIFPSVYFQPGNKPTAYQETYQAMAPDT